MKKSPQGRRPVAALGIVAIILGGLTLARAGCAFAVVPSPGSALPRTDIFLSATCLHDASGAPVGGATVTFQVTKPLGGTESLTAVTDEQGAATVRFIDTHEFGTYGVSASSGLASAASSFAIAPARSSGSFRVLSSPACLTPGQPVSFTATGIKDPGGNPVASDSQVIFEISSPESLTVTPVRFTRTGTTNPVATDTDLSSATALFNFKDDAGATHTRLGTWTVTAKQGAAQASTTFRVLSSINVPAVTSIAPSLPTSAVRPSRPATLRATVKDASGNPAQCAPVTFDVTHPGGAVSSITAQSDATGVATAVDVLTDAYGAHSVRITSGLLSVPAPTAPALTFKVEPAAVSSLTPIASPSPALKGSAVTIRADRVQDSSGNPAAGAPIKVHLWVDKPNGILLRHEATVVPGTSRVGRAAASATVPGSAINLAGQYTLRAFIGSPLLDNWLDPSLEADVYSFTYFDVLSALPSGGGAPVADLTISAANLTAGGSDNTIFVGGIPNGSDAVAVTVTKPDGISTWSPATPAFPFAGSASVVMPGSEIAQEGVYAVSATSSALGTVTGTGEGGFLVEVPRTLGLAISPTVVSMPGGAATITATFTGAGGTPVSGAQVRLLVVNSIGQTVKDVTGPTDANGVSTTTASGAETLVPGRYLVTAEVVGTIHRATGYFVVVGWYE